MNKGNRKLREATKQAKNVWAKMTNEEKGTLLFSDIVSLCFALPAKKVVQIHLNCDVKPSKKALAWFIGLSDQTRQHLAKKYANSHLPTIVNNIYLVELNLPSSAL